MTGDEYEDLKPHATCSYSKTWDGFGWATSWWDVREDHSGSLWARERLRSVHYDKYTSDPFPVVESTKILTTWEKA